MITLNQCIEILQSFTYKHKALGNSIRDNHFFFGSEWLNDSSVKIMHPFVNAILNDTKLSKDTVERSFTIVLDDLINKDNRNISQVLSDLEQIAFDLIYYLQGVERAGLIKTFKVSVDSTLSDFTDRGTSNTAGWTFDVTMSTHIGNNSCSLPINAGTVFNDNYIYVGGNTVTCGDFTVLIKDNNGNILETLNTSGEYIVTILSGIQDTITANTSTIIEPLT